MIVKDRYVRRLVSGFGPIYIDQRRNTGTGDGDTAFGQSDELRIDIDQGAGNAHFGGHHSDRARPRKRVQDTATGRTGASELCSTTHSSPRFTFNPNARASEQSAYQSENSLRSVGGINRRDMIAGDLKFGTFYFVSPHRPVLDSRFASEQFQIRWRRSSLDQLTDFFRLLRMPKPIGIDPRS
jgi:hypothetical protein